MTLKQKRSRKRTRSQSRSRSRKRKKINKKMYKIKKSSIHGKGVFAVCNIPKNKAIDDAIVMHWKMYPVVTEHFGSWINHAPRGSRKRSSKFSSNTRLKWDAKKQVYSLVATKTIKKGQEILADYYHTPFFIKKRMNAIFQL